MGESAKPNICLTLSVVVPPQVYYNHMFIIAAATTAHRGY